MSQKSLPSGIKSRKERVHRLAAELGVPLVATNSHVRIKGEDKRLTFEKMYHKLYSRRRRKG